MTTYKKTYIPGKPRNKKLTNVTSGAAGVGKTEFNQVAGDSHTHPNKGVLDQITEAMLASASRDMITSTDTETELTDENYLSSLRVLAEILKNNEGLKEIFLSKVDPDTAQEIIKFVKGIEIGAFTTGPLGAGASLKMENGVSRLEIDQLDVRMRATFRELIIESLKHIGGQLILSPARMKCNKVVDGGTYYKCYFDTGDGKVSNEFVAGDQARCQVFTGSGVKMYWRLVTSVGTDWINLSKTDAISGSSIPEAGDDIVQLGNRTDTTRQNAQILSTVGSDAPSWKQYKGINAFSLEGKDTTVFSGTGNKIDGKTVFMSSGANVEDGINSKNSNYSSQPTSYKANDTWTLSADQTVNGVAYKIGEILTATQDSTTFVQAHWVKKVRYTDDTAVEELQIGGRNLIAKKFILDWNDVHADITLRGSDADGEYYSINHGLLYLHVGNGEGYSDIFGGKIAYKPNTQYCFKLRWKVSVQSEHAGLVLYFTYSDGLYDSMFLPGSQTSITERSLVTTAGKTLSKISCSYGTTDHRTLIYDIQLTEGNKQTGGYLVAPEDVQAEISSAKQEALTAAGNAQASANTANMSIGNLNTYVDGSFKDGIIDSSEAKAIEKYINIVNSEKAGLEATYNKLYLNSYLEGVAKTTLLNSKVTYFGAVDTLLNSINTAIADGKTTVAEKQAVDTNYSSYKTALASLQSAIEEANKAIQTKLDTLSTEKVDNLEIGGRNLWAVSKSRRGLEYTGLYPFYGTVSVEDYTYTVSGNIEDDVAIKLLKQDIKGEYLHVQFQHSQNLPSLTFIVTYANASNQSLQNVTVTIPRNAKGIYSVLYKLIRQDFEFIYVQLMYIAQNSGLTYPYSFHNVGVYSSNKEVDWSPAPEDIQASIDAVNATASDAQAKANISKAVTDKFGTTIDGGLISTVITEYRELNSEQVTGLISGIQGTNKNLPFLVAGGTYAEGIAGTAKAIIRHDGTSKFTDAEVEGKVTAKEGKIGDMSIINGALTSSYSYFTYIGAVYVQVTVIMNLSQSGLTLTSSYGGTTDHPQVVTWTCEIRHTSIKVGSMEMRRDGIYRDGTKIL